MSRLANDSAACVYSVAFVALPVLVASSAISTAWRALVLTFSRSSIARLRRISVCFWLAITLAACSRNRRCCSCASMIACSSCTLGSARSLKELLTLAVQYFHQRLMALNMIRRLVVHRRNDHGETPLAVEAPAQTVKLLDPKGQGGHHVHDAADHNADNELDERAGAGGAADVAGDEP